MRTAVRTRLSFPAARGGGCGRFRGKSPGSKPVSSGPSGRSGGKASGGMRPAGPGRATFVPSGAPGPPCRSRLIGGRPGGGKSPGRRGPSGPKSSGWRPTGPPSWPKGGRPKPPPPKGRLTSSGGGAGGSGICREITSNSNATKAHATRCSGILSGSLRHSSGNRSEIHAIPGARIAHGNHS